MFQLERRSVARLVVLHAADSVHAVHGCSDADLTAGVKHTVSVCVCVRVCVRVCECASVRVSV